MRIKGIVETGGRRMHVEVTPALTKLEMLERTEAVDAECKIIVIGCRLREEAIREYLTGRMG